MREKISSNGKVFTYIYGRKSWLINTSGFFEAAKKYVARNDLAGVPYADFSRAYKISYYIL